MANKGQAQLLVNGLDADVRKALTNLIDYTYSWFSLGGKTKAENFAWYRVDGTTSSSANTEFSIQHGMDHIPQKAVPFLDFNNINSAMPVLTVTKAADANRIYLSSPSTGVSFSLYLE